MDLSQEGEMKPHLSQQYIIKFNEENFLIPGVSDFKSFQSSIRNELAEETQGKELKITYKLDDLNLTVKNEQNFKNATSQIIKSANPKNDVQSLVFNLQLFDKVPAKIEEDKQIMSSQLVIDKHSFASNITPKNTKGCQEISYGFQEESKNSVVQIQNSFKEESKDLEQMRVESFQKVSSIFLSALPGMKKEYIILLLGYTGQGKTSFLNFLYNVETVLKEFDGINQCEEFNDNSKENEQNYKMSSKTSAVTQYLVKIGQANLIVVDTPGLGDTRGSKIDEKHIEEIKSHVLSLGGANCIMIVQSGRESRLTDYLKLCIYQLCEIMPKQMKRQIMVVYTNCGKFNDISFDHNEYTKLLKIEESVQIPYMFFDNPFVQYRRNQQTSIDQQVSIKKLMKQFYHSTEQLEKGFLELQKFEKVPENQFRQLYDNRNEIDSQIGLALLHLQQTEQKIADLNQIKEKLYNGYSSLENVQKQIEELKKKTETKIITAVTKDHNSNCNHCKITCHRNCQLPFTEEGEKFVDCWINLQKKTIHRETKIDLGFRQYMYKRFIGNIEQKSQTEVIEVYEKIGKCQVCGCVPNAHTHAKYEYMRKELETEVYKALQKKLKEMQMGMFSNENSMKQLEAEIKALEQQQEDTQERIPLLIKEMSQYSIGPDLDKVKGQAIKVFVERLQKGNFNTPQEEKQAQMALNKLIDEVSVIRSCLEKKKIEPFQKVKQMIMSGVTNLINSTIIGDFIKIVSDPPDER